MSKTKFEPVIERVIVIDKTIDNSPDCICEPYHYLKWRQTGKRHYPKYYQRLQNSQACACFGGWFVPALLKHPGGKASDLCKAIYRRTNWHSPKILQWDSWRLWESWAAGCVVFHLDFEKYGVQLPVNARKLETLYRYRFGQRTAGN